jgi:hypothetical protein
MASEDPAPPIQGVELTARHRLPYAVAKLERADRTLSRVWTFQLLLVGGATLVVLRGWPALKKKLDDVLGVDLPPWALALLLAALLVYTFMRFGFALGQFLASREECDALVVQRPVIVRRRYGSRTVEENRDFSLFETTNLFEPLHQSSRFDTGRAGKCVRWVLSGLAVATVSASHAATFSLIYYGLRGDTTAALVVTVAVLGVLVCCYAMMCASKAGRPINRARGMLAAILFLSGLGTAAGILGTTALEHEPRPSGAALEQPD